MKKSTRIKAAIMAVIMIVATFCAFAINTSAVCAHAVTSTKAAVKATCKEGGNTEILYCVDCGTILSGRYTEKDPTNHTGGTEIKGAKAATCCEAGATGNTVCKGCNVTLKQSEVIPATGKYVDADGKWEFDGVQHYHTCAHGTKFDFAVHKGGEPTISKQPVCEICGASYGRAIINNKTVRQIIVWYLECVKAVVDVCRSTLNNFFAYIKK